MTEQATAPYTIAWARCFCGETWIDDIDPTEPWVIKSVAEECRAHFAAAHPSAATGTFDVGIER